MNLREALRRADPAGITARVPLNDDAEQLLRRIVATPYAAAEVVVASPPRRPARDRRPALVTAIVAAVVVVGAVVAIRSVPAESSGPAVDAGRSVATENALEAAVFARLIEAGNGESIRRDQPSLTWTEKAVSAQGGLIDLTGKTPYLAAACEGGGSIAIRITGRPGLDLDCAGLSALGPIALTKPDGNAADSAGIDVIATSGHPQYVVKLLAVAAP